MEGFQHILAACVIRLRRRFVRLTEPQAAPKQHYEAKSGYETDYLALLYLIAEKIMIDLKLQQDELELLASYEAEEWRAVKKVKERKERYRTCARAAFRKDKPINIRISEKDLLELQRSAIRQGIAYQTLVSSILHKYASGMLIGK